LPEAEIGGLSVYRAVEDIAAGGVPPGRHSPVAAKAVDNSKQKIAAHQKQNPA